MTEGSRPRAVFDCMVFLQGAARKESPAGLCLSLAQAGAVELFVSDGVLAEVSDVLKRPLLQRRFPALTPGLVDELVAALRATCTHLADVPRTFRYQRDPKDEPYLNLALAVHADYLVTRDTDLLDLASPGNADGNRLRQLYAQLMIVDPVSFLRRILA